MIISVIIPTYNGAQKILNVLRSIEEQTEQPNEVIVVIDGSTDNTETLLQHSTFKLSNFRIIKQANGGRAKVRNTGAKAATGDLLLFFDDDMRLFPDCVKEHRIFHEKKPGGIVTGGLKEEVLPDSSEVVKFKSYLSEKWNEPLIATGGKPLSANEAFITAANFSVSTEIFEKLGGFDERLNDAEDHDLTMRAKKEGIPLFFHNNAFAWHDDLITCKSFILRLRDYAKAQEKLAILRPEYEKKYYSPLPVGIKALVFKFFCNKFWINSTDHNIWKYLLPRKIRYKLYDLIITANGSFYPQKVKFS